MYSFRPKILKKSKAIVDKKNNILDGEAIENVRDSSLSRKDTEVD